jgi:hypothetical protein
MSDAAWERITSDRELDRARSKLSIHELRLIIQHAQHDMRAALKQIADSPAWGAPDRWENTPAEVRWLARDTIQ